MTGRKATPRTFRAKNYRSDRFLSAMVAFACALIAVLAFMISRDAVRPAEESAAADVPVPFSICTKL